MDLIAIDSMIVHYLVQAMSEGYNPTDDPNDHLRLERVAAFQLFLWSELNIPPTVVDQLSAAQDANLRARLERLVILHLGEPHLPSASVLAMLQRVVALQGFHSDEGDCRIVAESEVIGASALLSFDHRLRRRLAPHTALQLLTPSDYWERLEIPRGTPPRWSPAPNNPMGKMNWWNW